MSQSPPKDTAGSSSMSIVIKAKKSCPLILLLVRWTNWLCRASASKRSGGNVPANFSLIFPANCLGSRFIVMRIALLDDVICAKHIVRDVLMMSKTSDHAQFPGHAFVSLMHMGESPRWRSWARRLKGLASKHADCRTSPGAHGKTASPSSWVERKEMAHKLDILRRLPL